MYCPRIAYRMAAPKLFSVLQSFTDDEHKAFAKFLEGGFHNGKQLPRNLWRKLKSHHPEYVPERINERTLYRSCYPKQDFDKIRLNKAYNELLGCAEQFLVHYRVKHDPLLYASLLRREGRVRHLDEHLPKVDERIERLLDRTPTGHELLHRRLLHRRERLLSTPATDQSHYADRLTAYARSLDRFYLFERLRIEYELINRQHIFRDTARENVPRTVAHLLPVLPDALLYQPPIGGWLFLYRLLSDGANTALTSVPVEQLRGYLATLSRLEARELLVALLNIVIRRVNADRAPASAAVLTNLYKAGLDLELFVEHGKMNALTFFNICMVTTGVGEIEFAREFIAEYAPLVEESERAGVKALAQGLLAFHAKNYPEAVDRCRNTVTRHALLNLRGRETVIRALYCQSREDPQQGERWLAECRAFLTWLKDHERRRFLAPRHLRVSINFAMALRALFREDDRALAQAMAAAELNYRQWLLLQIEEKKGGN